MRCSRPPLRLALCPLIALFAGCARERRIPSAEILPPLPYRQAGLDEVLAAYESYARGLTSVSGSGDLGVSDLRKGRSRRIGVRVLAQRGGRLYLKGSVTVVTVLEVVSDGARFWFSVPSKKTVWTGPAQSARTADESADTEAPYRALRPQEVSRALLPEPLAPQPGDSLVFEAEPRSFSLTLVRSAGGRGVVRRRVSLSRDTLQLVRASHYNADGELESEARFASWSNGSPQRVTIFRPREGYEAAFALDKMETNVSVPDRLFAPRLPEGYSIVEVED